MLFNTFPQFQDDRQSPSDSVGANLAVTLVRSYGESGNGNMNYFPAFGDDIVVAIDSDIMNEAGPLLRMRLVYCFRGKVNAFLKKAYLGGCCYQRRTGHQVCHPVHFRWAGPKYFMESERWLGHEMTRSQLAHPGCGVDEQGHREALVAAERCTSD